MGYDWGGAQMTRKLIDVNPDLAWHLKPDALSERPHIGSLVARCLALWSETEAQEAILLGVLMGVEQRGATMAIFSSLKTAWRQGEILKLASSEHATLPDKSLVPSILESLQSLGKVRNKLAHDIWITDASFPNEAFLIKSEEVAKFGAAGFYEQKTNGTSREFRTLNEHIEIIDADFLTAFIDRLTAVFWGIVHAIAYVNDPIKNASHAGEAYRLLSQ